MGRHSAAPPLRRSAFTPPPAAPPATQRGTPTGHRPPMAGGTLRRTLQIRRSATREGGSPVLEHTIDVGAVALNYVAEGREDGGPLVFLHGVTGRWQTWL